MTEAPLNTQKRVFDILQELKNTNLHDALATKEWGEWVRYSGQELAEASSHLSLGLRALGVKKDDKIALISPNRTEWNIVDFGVQQLGAVLVPMYPTITVEDYRYIFEDAQVKYIFVANDTLLKKVNAAKEGLNFIQGVFTIDEIKGEKHWKEVLALGKSQANQSLEEEKAAVKGEDLLTLIYTSGTTGKPKGVMLTHHNLMSNVDAVKSMLPLKQNFRALSFLPLCHVYERMVIYLYMSTGVAIYYAESMDTIAENIREVKPHTFTTVPRLLEKVYDKIVSKGHELTGIKKTLFFWALNLGLKYDPNENKGWWYNMQMKVARKLVLSKWKDALGGNLAFISSGSAALQQKLARIFWAAEIPVCEGYGLTETSPVVTTSLSEPITMKIGCVGIIIPEVEVKIADDGEILVKGPNVMKGYYNRPDLTAEVIDNGGYFHTGDIGEIVEGKYLKITDRKKEMFKTSGGKYVAPQMVENKLKESLYIEQAVVVGEGQKFPSALIAPNFDALKTFCEENKIQYDSDSTIVSNQEILNKIQNEIEQANRDIAQYERVKKFKVLPALMSEANGELTPTLKPKRKVIASKYKELIESMYD